MSLDASAEKVPDDRRLARVLLALALLCGVALHLPALGAGFFADDYVHQLVLASEPGATPMSRWSLYDFGTAAEWRAAAEDGAPGMPWWADDDWKARFFRPVASALLVAEHALWGANAIGCHATSLALWLAVLALAHRLFLALGLSARAAALGTLVLALADASSFPVGWIANRNTLLEAAFACGALLAALRGRFALALACALLAAGSKESGAFALPVVAGACALRGGAGDRARAALAAALFVAYLGALAIAGFGTRSMLYATPWVDVGRYLENVALLATGGVLSLLAPLPLDLAVIAPHLRVVLIVLGVVVGWPLALWIARRVRREPGAALLALWTLAFLAPQGGVDGSDRLLCVPMIGAAGLLGAFFDVQRRERASRSRVERAGVRALLVSTTVLSGALLLAQNVSLADLARHVRAKVLAIDLAAPPGGALDVLVLQAENQMQAFAVGSTWSGEGRDPNVRFHAVNASPRSVRWTRVGESTFELEALDGAFLEGPFERVYLARPLDGHRLDARPLDVQSGHTWTSGFLRVASLDPHSAALRRIRVELPRSLDDPTLAFVRPMDGVLRPIAPPRIGESLELPRAESTRRFTP